MATLARHTLTVVAPPSPAEFVTRFQVAPQGNGYAFQVVAQETIR